MIEHFYLDDKFGTLNMFTAESLYRDMIISAPNPARFVECGTHRGRSAAFMGVEIANSGKKIDFTTIDIHPGLHMEANKNLQPLIEAGYVRTLLGDSVEKAAEFADQSVDFLFLDAGHQYEEVLADIDAWMPKMRIGSIMAGDDYWWTDLPEPVYDQTVPKFSQWKLRPSFPVSRAVHQRFPEYELVVSKNWAKWLVRL